MVHKYSIKQKAATLILAVLVLFSALPIGAVTSGIAEGLKRLASSVEKGGPPTSLDDVTIPTVTKNPHDVDVSVDAYPIFNDAMYDFLDGYWRKYFSQYGTHDVLPDGYSPYFTASIAPWYDYEVWIDHGDDMVIESTLPYREGRESIYAYEDRSSSDMFHSELTLTNGGITVRPINNFQHLDGNFYYKELLSGYLTEHLGLNIDQTYIRIGATLISGNGGIHVSTPDTSYKYSVSGKATDGEPVRLTLDVPLSDFEIWSIIYFDADAGQGGVMTDFHLALIDNTSPSVNSMTVEREVREDYTADLILTMQLNERLRFTHENVKNELDDLWVELELLDLSTNERSNVRLYLESFDGARTLTFRGDIGLYNYKNFRVNRVTKASFAEKERRMEYAFIDLADEMYVSAYETRDYDNRILWLDTFDGVNPNKRTTAICDFAGNPINASSITNWSFGNQSYISNTFEAIDVRLYNERTVGLANGEEPAGDANSADMLVGPANELFVYVYLDQYLTEEEASLVSVELNLLNSDGSPLVVGATSSSDYKIEEVYGDTTEGTLIRFENIPLRGGMKLNVEEGIKTEPLIRVTKMTDEIEGRTAFANVVAPSNKLYADFTAPSVAIEKYAVETYEPEANGIGKYYKVSLSISIEDVSNYSQIAGVLGMRADVSIGGGVDKATRFRYLFSESAVPPEDPSGYGQQTLELVPNGMCPVGSAMLVNETNTWYLHLLIESNALYIDSLFVAVEAEDLVGNLSEIDPPNEIEYLVDEIAPEVSFTSQSMSATNGNTEMDVSIGISASDRNSITGVYYYRENEAPEGEAPVWIPLVIEPSGEIDNEILLHYGGLDAESSRTYSDTLWVKAVDEYGNESEPIAYHINLSLEKPSTKVSYEGDLNVVSNRHKITVTGPDASSLGAVGYTRVTLTPLDAPEYSYVTLVKTGETVDLLSFVGMEWYRVKTVLDTYADVSLPETVTEAYALTEQSVLYGLLSYYGELKISFENGYGSMTPSNAPLYAAADAGSYAADPNYYVVRFASPYLEGMTVHSVDFGSIVNREGVTVVADADLGNAPYRYDQTRKGINPMRNTAIYFTLSNAAREDFGLLDFNHEGSYMELIRVGENGAEDAVVARREGLAAGASQFFMIGNETDRGEFYTTGAYYLRVTVVSHSGSADSYESSRIVLDAQTPDRAGVWQYSYQTNVDITSLDEEKGYSWVTKYAENQAFDSVGVAVKIGGEEMRSSVFAVYSYGVSGLSLIFSAPDTEASYEGISVGGVKGFRVWNLASEPTLPEINAQPFVTDSSGAYLSRITGLDDIYTSENIPKGMDSFGGLYLMKGVNTICYQVAMKNGYVSPVKQLTVIVTDYTPELNIAIADYSPSHEASQIEGVVNASRIRFFVETAYSLNGTGEVSVDLWSDYGMNVGLLADGALVERYLEDPTPLSQGLGILRTGMKVEDYADFTENSYTSNFPRLQSLCTAVFVATDEYGGVTVVAPQIGDHIRYGTWGGEANYDQYNIDYSAYYGDPYVVGDSFTSKRVYYNEPIYFGKELLRFENAIYKNLGDGDEELVEITMVSNPELKHNLFNIVTNDIIWNLPREYNSASRAYAGVEYEDAHNLKLINWDSATVTFWGDDLEGQVTLPLSGADNGIGYMGAGISSVTGLTLSVANPQADASHPAGATVTRNYTIRCRNLYGDSFETSGTVTLYTSTTALP
ncbi:MAG: hypothetical protein E7620_05275, partial [Ruminococcaceae bacterium]|nr:hypothetical protein [Oscillospiraceae bacterium]